MGTDRNEEEDFDFPDVDLGEVRDHLGMIKALIDSIEASDLWGCIYPEGGDIGDTESPRRIPDSETIKEVRGSGDNGPVSSPSLPVCLTVSISPESLSRLQERLSRFREIMQDDGYRMTPVAHVKPIKDPEEAIEDFGDFIYWRTRARENTS